MNAHKVLLKLIPVELSTLTASVMLQPSSFFISSPTPAALFLSCTLCALRTSNHLKTPVLLTIELPAFSISILYPSPIHCLLSATISQLLQPCYSTRAQPWDLCAHVSLQKQSTEHLHLSKFATGVQLQKVNVKQRSYVPREAHSNQCGQQELSQSGRWRYMGTTAARAAGNIVPWADTQGPILHHPISCYNSMETGSSWSGNVPHINLLVAPGLTYLFLQMHFPHSSSVRNSTSDEPRAFMCGST